MIRANELIVDLFAGGGGASLGILMATGRHPDVAVNHDPQAVGLHSLNHPSALHLCNDVRKVSPAEVLRRGAEHRGFDPRRTRIGLLHASPDCKHFSKAKGGQPRDKKIRDLAWVVTRYAQLPRGQRPRLITLENVEEFRDWGPLVPGPKGLVPCPARKGQTFNRWYQVFLDAGYDGEIWEELVACEYGTPTIRARLFILLRDDGLPIVDPRKTHAPIGADGIAPAGMLPQRTAAEIIDWSLPCPSIFLTRDEAKAARCKRPLADATMARIARGIKRYVLDNPRPFIVPVTHSGDSRVHSIDDPLRTVTAARRGEMAYVEPHIVGVGGRMAQSPPRSTRAPFQTVTAKADSVIVAPHITKFRANATGHAADEPLHTVTSNSHGPKGRPGGCAPLGVVAGTLVQTGYGERAGQAPRALDPQAPLGTVVAGGGKHAAVAAFLAQHNTGRVGHDAHEPVSTITGSGSHQAVVAGALVHTAHGERDAKGKKRGRGERPVDEALPTVTASRDVAVVFADLAAPILSHAYSSNTAGGQGDMRKPVKTVLTGGHHAQVVAFLTKYFGTPQDPRLEAPLHTTTTKPRHGLVTVTIDGEPYALVDIGMRMLTPRELYRAQGFPDSYIIDRLPDGSRLPADAQVRMAGNSVCPQVLAAILRANLAPANAVREAAE